MEDSPAPNLWMLFLGPSEAMLLVPSKAGLGRAPVLPALSSRIGLRASSQTLKSCRVQPAHWPEWPRHPSALTAHTSVQVPSQTSNSLGLVLSSICVLGGVGGEKGASHLATLPQPL